MTTTIGEVDTDQDLVIESEEQFDEPCEDYQNCWSSAEYECCTRCCGFKFYLCEDCLFANIDWIKSHEGQIQECMICNNRALSDPNFIVVLRKLKS